MKEDRSDIRMALSDLADPAETDALLEVWRRLGTAVPPHPMDPTRTDFVRQVLVERAGATRGLGLRVWIAAAVLIAGVGLTTLWGLTAREFTAPSAAIARVDLPDGSVAVLAPGSRLGGWARWSPTRSVELTGQAWFDVSSQSTAGADVKAAGRPFTVTTADALITVVGTQFAVRSWPGSLRPGTSVHLEEGRIALQALGNPAQVELAAGDSRHVLEGRITGAIDYGPEKSAAWRDGDFVFFNERLDVVLEEVGRRFGLTISLATPAAGAREVSGVFRDRKSAEEVIRDLAIYLGMQYRTTTTGFELTGGG